MKSDHSHTYNHKGHHIRHSHQSKSEVPPSFPKGNELISQIEELTIHTTSTAVMKESPESYSQKLDLFESDSIGSLNGDPVGGAGGWDLGNFNFRDAIFNSTDEFTTSAPGNYSDLFNYTNTTYDDYPQSEFPYYIKTASTLFCAIILVIGIIGNILVPVVVWRNKELRSSTNIFLINLSLADLLVLIVCVPTGLVELHTEPEVWVLGATMCKLVPFAELSVAHASVLTILAISLERYIAICRPLRANYTCTKQRAIALCIAIWIIGFIATIPMLFFSKHRRLPYIDRSIRPACFMEADDTLTVIYFLTSIAIFFFLPLFLLIALYWVIARSLMSDPCNTSAVTRTSNGVDNPNMRARKQVVVMLATVVLFFFVCLLPFRIFSVYIILAPTATVGNMGEALYYNILYMCRMMLYFNSAVNPILYNVMSSKFREAFFKVLGCPIGPSGRSRWLCRHLSRQSTFTTTSTTLQNSSVKSLGVNQSKVLAHHVNGGGVDSFRVRELHDYSCVASSRFGANKKSTASRCTSGPYYPNPPKRQMSSDCTVVVQHCQGGNSKNIHKKVVIRANSVV